VAEEWEKWGEEKVCMYVCMVQKGEKGEER